jgi:hypothetical protein
MNWSILAAASVVVLFAVYTVKHVLAETDLPDHRRWFVPVILLWIGLAPAVRQATDPLSKHDFPAAALWAALFVAAAWWRHHVRQKGVRLPRLGSWERPSGAEVACFLGAGGLVASADLATKAALSHEPSSPFVRADSLVCSSFHHDPITYYHPMMLAGILMVTCVGGVFFRLRHSILAYAWRVCAGSWLGAAITLVTERAIFRGVHNVFCVRGTLVWVCPMCAVRYPNEYAFCIADFFVFWPQVLSLLAFLVIYVKERFSPSARGEPGTTPEEAPQAR